VSNAAVSSKTDSQAATTTATQSGSNLARVTTAQFTTAQSTVSKKVVFSEHDLLNLLGQNAYKILKQLDCDELVATILSDTDFPSANISVDHITTLFSLPLPLLSTLIQGFKQLHPHSASVIKRPLKFVPLVALIEQRGMDETVKTVTQELQSLPYNFTKQPLKVSIAIDRWRGVAKFSSIVSTINAILSNKSIANIQFLGPSTADLSEIIASRNNSAEISTQVKELLFQLAQAGITRIDGGSNFEIHQLSAEAGFTISYAEDLSAHTQKETSTVKQLQKSRNILYATGKMETWFPWAPTLLRRNADAPSFARVLRSLAVARLILPKTPYIKASTSLTGAAFAQITPHYGANDLGYFAIDAASAKECGIPLLTEPNSSFDELAQSFIGAR